MASHQEGTPTGKNDVDLLSKWYCEYLPKQLFVVDLQSERVTAGDAASLALACPPSKTLPLPISEIFTEEAIEVIRANRSGAAETWLKMAPAIPSEAGWKWRYQCLIPGEWGVLYLDANDSSRISQKGATDPHTGLLTRGALWPVLEESLSRFRANGLGFAVIFLDVDYFKPINDQLGHLAGDEVLRCVADGILHAIRPGDSAIRYGGDEIVLVINGLNSRDEAAAVGRRLAQAIPQSTEYQGKPIAFTVSMGVAFCRPEDATPQAILERADLAMYRAKNRGRRGEIEVD